MNKAIHIVFFNLRFRLYVLRIIILSALVATVSAILIYPTYLKYGLDYPIGWTALFAFITVHHILVAGRPKFLLAILDLLLAIGEVIATGFYITVEWQYGIYLDPLASGVIIYHAISIYILLACLSLLTIFRLANVVRSYGKTPIRPLDMFDKLWPNTEDRSTISILFGRTFWKEHFKGESKIVRVLRGLLGLGILVLLFFYGMLHLVYDPIRETSLTPVQEYRATGLPMDYKIGDMLWNIVIMSNTDWEVSELQQIIESITVTPLQDSTDPSSDCTLIPLPPVQAQAHSLPYITYQCYTIQQLEDGSYYALPEGILITVNYTTIPQLDKILPGLNVVVGLFNETSVGVNNVVPKSASLYIVPGVNLIAVIIPNIREVFVNAGLAAFGMYQATKAMWIGTVSSIYPDPFPDIPRDPAVSTLRLYIQYSNPTELSILSEQRDNTVLAGFSALGGLWTPLGGLFAFMFGGSLLNYLYGSKNISVLGAVHSFNHTRLREGFLRKYPDLAKEENQGILALLRDHIIDLDFLKDPSSSSSTEPDVERGHIGADSSNPEATTRRRPSDATGNSESDTVEKHSLLVDSQFAPTSTHEANDASDKILRPLRRQPSE